ncbi:MAG: tetratricopeptide repeat protein [Leptospirales bacterium]|jgi:tetratricopeptide (TPR) repeat protein
MQKFTVALRAVLCTACICLAPAGCSEAGGPVVQAKYQKALEAYAVRDLEQARKLLFELRDESPGYPGVRVMLGKVLYHGQEYDAALELMAEAYEVDAGNLTALMWVSRIYRIQGDARAALQAIDTVVGSDSANIEAWYLKGQVHESLGQIDDAIAAYRYGLQEGEKLALIHMRLEELYRNAGFDQKADAHRAKAITFIGEAGN